MRILAFSSAYAFGGHELMALKGLEALVDAGHEIVLACHDGNGRLCGAGDEMASRHPGRLRVHRHPFAAGSLQIVRTWLNLARMARLARLVRRFAPDVVLALQGDIEQGSEIFLPARMAGVPLVSYVPMVLTGAERGIRLGAIRDALSRPLYRLASRMVVISAHFSARANAQGVRDVRLVRNCIDAAFLERPVARTATRAALGVREDERLSGFVGRIAYDQKGLDRLVEMLRSDRAHFEENRVLVVGSGPDEARFDDDLRRHGLGRCVLRRAWSDERVAWFDALDVFLCTSRFEGMPLTILEALSRDVPVACMPLAPLVDELPLAFAAQEWNARAFAALVARQPLRAVHDGVVPTPRMRGLDRTSFDAAFVAAVTG